MDISSNLIDLPTQTTPPASIVKSVKEEEEIQEKAEILDSINHLINSCVSAQKAGVYTLQEAAAIVHACNFLQTKFGKASESN